MYGQSGDQRIPATMTTGTTSTSAIDIRDANRVAIELATFAGACGAASTMVYVQGCATSDGTFRRVQTDSTTVHDWATLPFTGNRTVMCDAVRGFPFIKVELGDTSTTAALGCWVHKIY
jgi:hypothetical protein